MAWDATDVHGSEGARESSVESTRMPSGVRMGLAAVITVLLVGALYLIAVRGEALLVDLAKLGAALCF